MGYEYDGGGCSIAVVKSCSGHVSEMFSWINRSGAETRALCALILLFFSPQMRKIIVTIAGGVSMVMP